MRLELEVVKIDKPDGLNVVIGQTHFIKSVEDISEALISSVPSLKYGLAFCEASGKCLIRLEGNDPQLKNIAQANALNLGCGHTFFLILKDAYPINVLNSLKNVMEVCQIFCATANPLEVIVAQTEQGRGILGVIDGFSPQGVEGPEEIKWRKELLRKMGYKFS